jgi:general stress protein 26
MNTDHVRARMLEMIEADDICVLATADASAEPHASLMGYVFDERQRRIYMMTQRETRKYKNIIENPRADLLIRERGGESALTVSCSVSVVGDTDETDAIKNRISKLRPGLKELAAQEEVEVLAFVIESILLLDGPVTSHFRNLQDTGETS